MSAAKAAPATSRLSVALTDPSEACCGDDELRFSPKACSEQRNSWVLTVRATTVPVEEEEESLLKIISGLF